MNKNYKDYIISQGGKEIGLAFHDIKEYLMTPNEYKRFLTFMKGQTCALIAGFEICYTCDYLKFINNIPNTD